MFFSCASTSYRIWSWKKTFCLFILSIQLNVFFLCFNFISNMKLKKNFLLIHFFYSAKCFFSCASTSYRIWSWKKSFCWFILSIQQNVFFLCINFISNMKLKKIFLLIHFFYSAKCFFPVYQLHIEYEVEKKLFADSFFLFS